MGSHPIVFEICRYIYKHLVYRIDMNVLRRDVMQVYFIDARAVLDVMRHTRLRDKIVNGKFPVRVKFSLGM